MNIELETPQRPRLSVKVGYYFNGIERPNMGNTCPHTTLASGTLIFLPEAAREQGVFPGRTDAIRWTSYHPGRGVSKGSASRWGRRGPPSRSAAAGATRSSSTDVRSCTHPLS